MKKVFYLEFHSGFHSGLKLPGAALPALGKGLQAFGKLHIFRLFSLEYINMAWQSPLQHVFATQPSDCFSDILSQIGGMGGRSSGLGWINESSAKKTYKFPSHTINLE